MFEGDAAGLVRLDKEFVDAFGAASCGETKDEGTVFGGGEVIDAFLMGERGISVSAETASRGAWPLTDNVLGHVA